MLPLILHILACLTKSMYWWNVNQLIKSTNIILSDAKWLSDTRSWPASTTISILCRLAWSSPSNVWCCCFLASRFDGSYQKNFHVAQIHKGYKQCRLLTNFSLSIIVLAHKTHSICFISCNFLLFTNPSTNLLNIMKKLL